MECGDLSPLWTGQFIGPPGASCGGRGGEINGRLSVSALEIAVKSGDKSQHSITNRALSKRSYGLILVEKWYHSLSLSFLRESPCPQKENENE
jgi:hypothetical protein